SASPLPSPPAPTYPLSHSASDAGDPTNGSRVAPCWLSAVLEMAFLDQTRGWPQAGRQGSARAGLSHGENPTWGAPRIHGELQKLGFTISEPTVSLPTLTFGVLYCFFIIAHDRRRILRFHVTRNPSSLWIVQQMREAWPYSRAERFLLFDQDANFGGEVIDAPKMLGSEPVRTAFRSPWQNAVAERWGEAAAEICWIM